MKNYIMPLVLLLVTIGCFGQSFNLTFDHTALLVEDLERSADFYKEILQLEEIDTPGNNPSLRWFSLGNNHQLHLIKAENNGVKLHKAIHFAVNLVDFDGYVSFLEDKEIKYSNWPGDSQSPSVRADGVKQVYIQDPDGYWIEINDAIY